MKEKLLIALALLLGIFLLPASIVWAAVVSVVNRFRKTPAYN